MKAMDTLRDLPASICVAITLLLVPTWIRAEAPTTAPAGVSTIAPATGAAMTEDVRVLDHAPKPDERIDAPIAYWEETFTEPRPLHVSFLRVDLASDYEAVALLTDDPDGTGPATATLTPPMEIAKRYGVVAAVNANAFAGLLSATEEEKKRGWYTGKPVYMFGSAISDGEVRSPAKEGRIPIWFDAAGNGHVGVSADAKPRQAVANWEGPILADGEIVADKGTALHPRTLAGVDKDGRFLLLVVVDGRQKGYSEGMNHREMAEMMQAHGCYSAINMDGGGSSIMIAKVDGSLKVMNRPSGGQPRPIPVMLGIRKEQHSK